MLRYAKAHGVPRSLRSLRSLRRCRRARCVLRLIGGCALSLLVAPPASADGFLRDGLGPIPAGRGATNVAHADNGSVLLDNPAALANLDATALADVHIGQYLFSFRYVDAENAATDGTGSPLPIADAAYLARSTRYPRLGYGFGLFVPAGFGASYGLHTAPAFGPGRQRYESFAAFAKLVGGVAYRLTEELSIGANVGLAAAYVKLEQPYWVQTGALAGAPVRVRIRGTGFAPTWAVGAQWAVRPGTVVGASYASSSDFDADGRAKVTLGEARDEFDSTIEIGLPRAVAAGVRHDVASWVRLSAEATWRDWSDAFDEVGFDLSGGAGAFGSAKLRDEVALAWRDTWTFGIGGELFSAAGHVLRLGYAHHRSPVPDSSLTPVIPVTLEHVLSAGAGWRFGSTQVDLSYQYTFGPERGVERSGLVGGDFDASRQEVSGHAWFVGVTQRWGP